MILAAALSVALTFQEPKIIQHGPFDVELQNTARLKLVAVRANWGEKSLTNDSVWAPDGGEVKLNDYESTMLKQGRITSTPVIHCLFRVELTNKYLDSVAIPGPRAGAIKTSRFIDDVTGDKANGKTFFVATFAVKYGEAAVDLDLSLRNGLETPLWTATPGKDGEENALNGFAGEVFILRHMDATGKVETDKLSKNLDMQVLTKQGNAGEDYVLTATDDQGNKQRARVVSTTGNNGTHLTGFEFENLKREQVKGYRLAKEASSILNFKNVATSPN